MVKTEKSYYKTQSQSISVSGSGSIDRDCQGVGLAGHEPPTNCGHDVKNRELIEFHTNPGFCLL